MNSMDRVHREDARRWTSPSSEDAAKVPDPAAIVRILARETTGFEKPLGTVMKLERRTPFELLVSTICSARTKDSITAPIMRRLFETATTPEQFVHLSLARLRKLLYPVSYYHTKARHVKATAALLLQRFGGQVPQTMEDLIQLPGVGRKTANLVLSEGFGKVEGICVDTHVHRISNRLGLVRTKSREETERSLMRVLSKRFWVRWNPLLVMWGQNVCTSISPKCSTCPIRRWCQRRGVTTHR